MNEYRALAEYYDRLMAVDYPARAAYLLSLFEKHAGRPSTLLDLACGSGSLTAALTEHGIDVIGVDGSQDMLALAMEKCPQSLLLCQDMRELDLYDVVDGAVCTLDSLNHLLSTHDLAAVFDRLRLFVAPGGLFIFDVNTPYKHEHSLGDQTFVLEDEDVLCVWQNTYRPSDRTVDMVLDFFEEGPDGRYDRLSDEVRERAYSLATWKRLLADAQFELLAVYGDMTTDEPTATEDRWVLVARNGRPAEEFSA
ncbi:MAG: class I SAM-dependent methyltransferase [Clostridia bacterium]|nr:class I SAM-dependent methyltransferase [Clostridia bacterium]